MVPMMQLQELSVPVQGLDVVGARIGDGLLANVDTICN